MSAAAACAASPRLAVVEASAGTGKTHRITELVADRVVHGGVPIERILVVTFTRAATAELRGRIRRRLVELSHDPDLADTAVAAARRAVVSFDLAAITTIHGFCHQALALLDGTTVALREGLVSDDNELRNEVVNDMILAQVAIDDGTPHPLASLFTADPAVLNEKRVRDLVRTMLSHPAARLHLGPSEPAADGAWADLLTSARDAVLARRTATGVLTHDDVVRRTCEAVRADHAGRRELAARYQVVLVDEFQDTDAQQWEIIRSVFLAPETTTEVVVVGDPKQAIYSFRGADVHAYLVAREAAGSIDHLGESWRMEPGLISATNLLFRGASFGEDSIEHHDLATPGRPPGQRTPRLTGDSLGAEITVRVVPNDKGKPDRPLTYVASATGRQRVADDVADTVGQLLASPGRITPSIGPERSLRPSDIAVLVGTHGEADLVATALRQQGIRSVQRGTANVATSDAAVHWRWVLDAMQRPAAPSSASLAALSWFVGWSADRLAAATDDDIVAVQEQLVEWRRVLAHGGVPAFLAAVRAATGLARRLLARPDGERAITDLEHLGELFHAALPDAATPAELLDVLDSLATDVDAMDERVTRRVDSDDDAIQLITVHASKGLQFPVTLVPYLWTPAGDAPLTYHEGHDLWIDATIAAKRSGPAKAASDAERWGTDARLLYVALTRAQHRVVVWWGCANNSPDRPLTRLLLNRTADGARVDPALGKCSATTDEVLQRLDVLRTASKGRIRGGLLAPAQQRMPLAAPPGGALAVCSFDRHLPRGRARHSFSSLVAGAHAVPDTIATNADDELDPVAADISDSPAGADGNGATDARVPVAGDTSPIDVLARLELAGTDFGTAMHTVFETIDFAAVDLDDEIDRALDLVWPWLALPVERERLAEGITAVLAAPTGRHLGGRPLATISRRDRLDELAFELPLATGGAPVRADRVARLIVDHLPAAHPMYDAAERLVAETAGPTSGRDGMRVDLRGHLTGSIDLVVRVPGPDGPRFVVCDYKTNRLTTPRGATSPLDGYAPERLWPAMAHHHYSLQAILYGVALHRYLRWRLPGYRPEHHLGGAAYLFVRGMAGPATPVIGGQPYGVCSFDVPPALTVALSDLLDGSQP